MKRRRCFTLVELMAALLIFGVASLYLMEQRSDSVASAHYAAKSLQALEIIDEVLAVYRLNPFSEEPLPLKRDYTPFVVKVDVQPESINILPEEWRLEEDPFSDSEKEQKRLILRVSVDVAFPKMGGEDMHHVKVSTLIRHIELMPQDEEN